MLILSTFKLNKYVTVKYSFNFNGTSYSFKFGSDLSNLFSVENNTHC